MMQLKHENILPFYGVSMEQVEHENIVPPYGVPATAPDFCLVFPWYRNGNIMDYLKGEPDINRFDLASASRQNPHS